MFDHADPEFEAKYHFCRFDCNECDRLDREALESGISRADVLAEGVDLALAAIAAGEQMPEIPQ